MIKSMLTVGALVLAATTALAAPATYTIDAAHTYPSFEADHMGGLSIWRGKFNGTTGKVTLDQEARSGTVDITIDVASVDFGNDKLNEHSLKEPKMFDVARYPIARYQGRFSKWGASGPTEVAGELTLHGVTKPVTLQINHFVCKEHPMRKKPVCGADAYATFNRFDFGMTYGDNLGFKPDIVLRIEVEAFRD